jgi:hypothetical protein
MVDFALHDSVTHKIVKLEDDWNNLLQHGLTKPYGFIIRKNGSYYEALNGDTGLITYGGASNAGGVSGASAHAVINTASTVGAIFLKDATYTITAELVLSHDVTGESKKNTIITTASATIILVHAKGQSAFSNFSIVGSGRANTNIGLKLNGKEAGSATNANFRSIIISDCGAGVQLEDNTWNNTFRDIYSVRNAIGVKGHDVSGAPYYGENAYFDKVWMMYDVAVIHDYGYYFEKTNSIKISNSSVQQTVYDALYIGVSNTDGWDVLVGCDFDLAGRNAVYVGADGAGGKVEVQGCWLKGGATDASNGHGFYGVNTDDITIDGGQIITYPNEVGPSGTHHGVYLNNCDYSSVSGTKFFGHASQLGDGVNLTGCTYCRVSGIHVSNALLAVREVAPSDFNCVEGITFSGLPASTDPVLLVGAQSMALAPGNLTVGTQKISSYKDFMVYGDLWLRKADANIKMGTADRPALVYELAGADHNLSIGYSGYAFANINLRGTLNKAWGDFMVTGNYKSSDGSNGETYTGAVATLTIKNGLVTAHT